MTAKTVAEAWKRTGSTPKCQRNLDAVLNAVSVDATADDCDVEYGAKKGRNEMIA